MAEHPSQRPNHTTTGPSATRRLHAMFPVRSKVTLLQSKQHGKYHGTERDTERGKLSELLAGRCGAWVVARFRRQLHGGRYDGVYARGERWRGERERRERQGEVP